MKNILLLAVLFVNIGLFAAKHETVSHKVQPKETLFRISLMYNSTVNDILQANPGLTASKVNAGAVVKVPKDTKMRDPEFVATFLGDKAIFTPISQIAIQIKADKPAVKREAAPQISMPVEKTAEVIKPAATEAPVQALAPKPTEDENPFLTPSEPKGGAMADEQPVKTPEAAEPASADNGQGEDENPFVTPRDKK